MRQETKTYKIYKFSELSEQAKQKAIEYFHDTNVDDAFWYEHIQEEIKEYGGELVAFDIDRGSFAEIKIDSPELFAKSILENHGKQCETYSTAKLFLNEASPLYSLDTDEITYEQEEELEELEEEFKKEISVDYLRLLRKEYEYLTSEEAIIESIECNEHEFLENGELYL